jgi:flagellin
MPLVIYSNLASLQARYALDRTQSATAASLQRLSSGLRIHSARDDAAGLAVSERMQAQWRGTDQGARNANDGISLMQVGDHALASMSDGLQHLRELAVQALNAPLSASDRSALDADLSQGLAELDRTAANTTFNGRSLLDGSFGTATFQIGSGSGDTLAVDLSTSMRSAQLGAIATATSADLRTSGGGFQFAGTYTTTAIQSLDFSKPTIAFSPGYTATANGPPTNYTGLGNSTVFKVDGASITLNQNYGSTGAVANAVQGQLDAISPGSYIVNIDSNGKLRFTKSQGAPANTTPPSVAGFSGNFASSFNGATPTNGVAPQTTTHAGFDVDGHAVSLVQNYADGNALVADIQQQLDHGAPGTFRVTGGSAGVSIAHVNGSTLPSVNNFSNAGTQVFGRRQSNGLTLHNGDLTVQVGSGRAVSVTGTFETPEDLARAVSAQVGDVVANIDSNAGTLQISARETVTIGGTQGGTGGAVGFTPAVNAPTGNLAGIDIRTVGAARDAVLRIDAAIDQVSANRGSFGATDARLEAIVSQARQDSAILQTAHGRIVDADMAGESAALARNQVLQQAGIAMVAQANVRSQDVLTLLR